jgi:ribose transport system substrate-binding protein
MDQLDGQADCGVDSMCLTMNNFSQHGALRNWCKRCFSLSAFLCVVTLCAVGCRSHRQAKIAFIPQTEGTILWESAHVGAEVAADRTGAFVYWNAPTREDDIEGQISLVERVVNGNYQGLVLAPDQALALISPVRHALARGIPTVIIGSPLLMPAGGNLYYILNDDGMGGRMAAQRVVELLKGHGKVALLGMNPDVIGTMLRAHAFEEYLATNAPDVQIVERRMGSYNTLHEQQVAEDTLRAYPDLDVIVALMSTATDGALSALNATPANHSIKVIGFDEGGLPPFDRNRYLDSIIQEDARAMGQQAVELIQNKLLGKKVSSQILLQPKLITYDNYNSPAVRQMLSQDWTLGHWHWSPIQ